MQWHPVSVVRKLLSEFEVLCNDDGAEVLAFDFTNSTDLQGRMHDSEAH